MPKCIPNQQNLPYIMKLNEITAAMQTYAAKRNQAGLSQMLVWFQQKNVFSYVHDGGNPPVPPATEAFIHVYPGIVNDELVMFVISANKDTANNPDIANDVQVCPCSWDNPVQASQLTDIPPDVALAWVENWIKNYQQWITDKIGTNNSIFSAIAVPQGDSAFGDQHNAFLALRPDGKAVDNYIADIVVQDEQSGVVKYFDTGKPVPPFPPVTGGAAAFYLLALV